MSIALELQCVWIHFDICLKSDNLGSIPPNSLHVGAKNMLLYQTLQDILIYK